MSYDRDAEFPAPVSVRVIEAGERFEATVDGPVPSVIASGTTYEAAVEGVFVEALKRLCKGWSPDESFYMYWENRPRLRPSPPPSSPVWPPDVVARFQKEIDEFDSLDNPRVYNLVVHTKEHHYFTCYRVDRDEAVALALRMLSECLNNPTTRSIDDDVEALSKEGETYRNLWGSAL